MEAFLFMLIYGNVYKQLNLVRKQERKIPILPPPPLRESSVVVAVLTKLIVPALAEIVPSAS